MRPHVGLIGLLFVVAPSEARSRNVRLDLVVSAAPDLRRITIESRFTFELTDTRDSIWFTFPGVERPDSLRAIALNNVHVPLSDIRTDSSMGETRFVLTRPPGLHAGVNQLLVVGVIAGSGNEFTHWGSWHPYFRSRAERVPIGLEVRAPRERVVIASGRHLGDAVEGNQRVSRWETYVPQGWVFLTIGDYRRRMQKQDGFSFDVNWPSGDSAFDAEVVGRLPSAIFRFYENEFGPSGVDAFRLIEIRRQEVTNFSVDGAVVISHGSHEAILRNPAYLGAVLSHELAHYWWGDLVAAQGAGAPWLTEGLAEYSRVLFERQGASDSLPWSYRNLLVVSDFADRQPPPLVAEQFGLDEQTVPYQKGAMVFRMLEQALGGPAVLRSVLRDCAAQYRYRPITVGDFVGVVNAHASSPLDWFFDQWLRRPTGPVLRLDSVRTVADGGGTRLEGLVVQESPAYRLDLPLVIQERDSASETRWITVREPRSHFSVPVTSLPQRVVLDPFGEVFKWYETPSLPVDYKTLIARLHERPCVYVVPPFAEDGSSEHIRAYLARRFPGIVTNDRQCSVEALIGPLAKAFRLRNAPSVPDPPPGSVTSFVRRLPEDGTRFALGFEGDTGGALPDVLIPEAPLNFVAVRGGAIVQAYAASLPTIDAVVAPPAGSTRSPRSSHGSHR